MQDNTTLAGLDNPERLYHVADAWCNISLGEQQQQQQQQQQRAGVYRLQQELPAWNTVSNSTAPAAVVFARWECSGVASPGGMQVEVKVSPEQEVTILEGSVVACIAVYDKAPNKSQALYVGEYLCGHQDSCSTCSW
jgi:hypothetical protein